MKKFNKASAVIAIAISGLLLAGCSSSGNDGSGALKIGSLLPETGNLAFLGPPEFAGIDLAIQDINAAGGVLGQDVEHLRGDSGDTSTDIAQQTADAHIAAGVGAIIGAASSGVSLTVIDKISSAGIVQMSPANTAPVLTDYADDGYYFRTAPSDTFQGAILGQLMAKNGAKNAVFLTMDDAYGIGLSKYARAAFTGTSTDIVYDPQAAEFAADVAKAKAARPDAIAILGFEETTKILTELIKQGIGPKNVKTYLVDGNLSGGAYKDLPAGVMVGVKATLPGVYTDGVLRDRLLAVDPALEDFSYAPESYDATILIALAAEQAGKTDGQSIRDNLASVSSGGTKCATFADCKALIADGIDIDYDGVSGPVDFDANGDPAKATMGVYEYTANDKYVPRPEQFISGDVPRA
jgi:ABC-type branched-subunit amino acid transport system substrate-binding protein|uniref:ABC transporter substrate-binding protein n=1 Tax=Candidatus Nanopelagicus sp. TaxID=2518620 RepID=UPI00404B1365